MNTAQTLTPQSTGSPSTSHHHSAFSARDIAFCGLFTALMAVGAWIHIMLPLGPSGVTISLQIFFAILAGFLLGPKRGFTAVAVYLLLGLLGLPVYAHGGGIAYLLKPTYGFLIGFALAAALTGFLRTHQKRRTLRALIIDALLGEMVYYAAGLVYYSLMVNLFLPGDGIGLAELLSVWFLSTVIPDGVISVLAALAAWRILPQIGALQNT